MNNYFISSSKSLIVKSIVIVLTFLLVSNFLLAQPISTNTSYNLNSASITGSFNTAYGQAALFNNTRGTSNVAIGFQSLYFDYGNYNTAIGFQSLYYNQEGYGNVANGFQSIFNTTQGNYNTANGFQALYSSNTGSDNVANGAFSLFSNSTGTYNTALGDSAGFNSLGSGNVFIGHLAGADETSSNKMYIGNDATKTLLYGDFSTGQLLLGNPRPTDYVFKGSRTLNVLGGIISDSVRVALGGTWADYVFANDYKLRKLEDLETFIKTNKHLPNIPSMAEVSRDGIDVAAMNSKLLEKIEELHLYMFQLQKQIDTQHQQISELIQNQKTIK